MTTPNKPTNESARSEASRDQCVLYLLGELTADETEMFEQRLALSPSLCDELLQQADLIANLSACSSRSSRGVTLVSPPRHAPLSRPVLVSLLASAACVVFLLMNVITQRTAVSEGSVAALGETSADVANESEDLLIARAWIDNQLGSIATDFAWAEAEVDDPVVNSIDEPTDPDATLSWMFIAVSASTTDLDSDALEAEATNDG